MFAGEDWRALSCIQLVFNAMTYCLMQHSTRETCISVVPVVADLNVLLLVQPS